MDRDFIIKDKTIKVKQVEVDGGEDFYIEIYRLPYNDIDLYNVLMIDAYRTPTSELLNREEIEKKYDISLIN